MMGRPFAVLAGVLLLAAWPSPVAAQRLTLSITPKVITFPSSDPDTVPIVVAAPIQLNYRVQQNQGSPWTITVLAGGHLLSGPSVVDISNVTWIATPAPPFQNGTLSATVAQRVASGTGNVANPGSNGSITFRLANAWTYSTGTYTQTVLFTLSAP
jgi:hypothetical protein